MLVSCDLVDWKWLKSLPGPRARCDALLDEPIPGKVESCFDVVKRWIISAIEHEDLSDALEALAGG